MLSARNILVTESCDISSEGFFSDRPVRWGVSSSIRGRKPGVVRIAGEAEGGQSQKLCLSIQQNPPLVLPSWALQRWHSRLIREANHSAVYLYTYIWYPGRFTTLWLYLLDIYSRRTALRCPIQRVTLSEKERVDPILRDAAMNDFRKMGKPPFRFLLTSLSPSFSVVCSLLFTHFHTHSDIVRLHLNAIKKIQNWLFTRLEYKENKRKRRKR